MAQLFKLSDKDRASLVRGALVALAGALVVFLTDVVANIDWGTWTPFVVAAASVFVNFLRKFLEDTR